MLFHFPNMHQDVGAWIPGALLKVEIINKSEVTKK